MENRHCAFCLQPCSQAKLCGGCKKRAYCSTECQKIDWSVTGSGQKHRNWCGKFEHGEEDVDWKVVPIDGKGLGVVALRRLPAKYRIMVEPVFTDPHAHPGISNRLKRLFIFQFYEAFSKSFGVQELRN